MVGIDENRVWDLGRGGSAPKTSPIFAPMMVGIILPLIIYNHDYMYVYVILCTYPCLELNQTDLYRVTT